MSHSLYFLRLPEGADADDEAAAAALLDRLLEAEPQGRRDPAAEARKEALALALMAADPTLARSEPDHREIARLEAIDEATARDRYRALELQGPEDGHRITVALHDDWAMTDMPWGRPANGIDEMTALWRIARVLVREGGYACYDPQGPNMQPVEDDDPWTAAARTDPEPASAGKRWWRFW
jgi:hypothetical protein